jgi:hypothetical protein
LNAYREKPPHLPFGHLLPAGEKREAVGHPAAYARQLTYADGSSTLPFLPSGEKVAEGRMRGCAKRQPRPEVRQIR